MPIDMLVEDKLKWKAWNKANCIVSLHTMGYKRHLMAYMKQAYILFHMQDTGLIHTCQRGSERDIVAAYNGQFHFLHKLHIEFDTRALRIQ